MTERNLVKQVADYSVEQYWIQSAPALVVVCATPEKHEMYYGLRGKRLYNIQDCAASIQNMLIAATDLGLGSCWIGAFEEEKIKALFSIPPDVRPQAIITLGYSDEMPNDRSLTPIENVVFFNRYGMRIEKLHIVLRDYSVEWKKQKDNLVHATRTKFKSTMDRLKHMPQRLKDKLKKK